MESRAHAGVITLSRFKMENTSRKEPSVEFLCPISNGTTWRLSNVVAIFFLDKFAEETIWRDFVEAKPQTLLPKFKVNFESSLAADRQISLLRCFTAL